MAGRVQHLERPDAVAVARPACVDRRRALCFGLLSAKPELERDELQRLLGFNVTGCAAARRR